MVALLPNRVVVVWAALVLATVTTWWLGAGHAIDDAEFQATVVLLIAGIKVRLVGSHFMGLKGAPRALRLVFDGWCVFLVAETTVLYLAL